MTESELDSLIEAAATPYRETDADGLVAASSAWHDLPPQAREELARRQWWNRTIEAATDLRGWSGTVRRVMWRIGFTP